jgi:hypothetical protein
MGSLVQQRGLFRTSYVGDTLREHYGLGWPESAWSASRHALAAEVPIR